MKSLKNIKMDDFFSKKMREKITKFLSPKTDKEVANIVAWFAYDGVHTNPEKAGVTKEDAKFIAEELLGTETFLKLVADLKGEDTKLFRRSSLSDREITNVVNVVFSDEVFNRFYKNTRKK